MEIINYKIYVDSRYYTVDKFRKSFFKKDKFTRFFFNLDLRVPEHITANKHLLQNQFDLMEPEAHQISFWYIRKINGYNNIYSPEGNYFRRKECKFLF